MKSFKVLGSMAILVCSTSLFGGQTPPLYKSMPASTESLRSIDGAGLDVSLDMQMDFCDDVDFYNNTFIYDRLEWNVTLSKFMATDDANASSVNMECFISNATNTKVIYGDVLNNGMSATSVTVNPDDVEQAVTNSINEIVAPSLVGTQITHFSNVAFIAYTIIGD
jgi:hypothetical protein